MCAICHDDLKLTTALDGCRHTYCFDCIKDWCLKKKNCPECRNRVRELKSRGRGIDDLHVILRAAFTFAHRRLVIGDEEDSDEEAVAAREAPGEEGERRQLAIIVTLLSLFFAFAYWFLF